MATSEDIEAIKADIADLKKDAKDLTRSLDGVIDQINRHLTALKQRIERLETPAA